MAVVLDATHDLTTAVDAVCALDPAHLADTETIQALHRQFERLNAATARATAAFDAGGAWQADGSRTAAAWLAYRCNQPVASSRRRVQLGRALRHMPAVERAWLAGDVSEAHVGLFASVRTPGTETCFERDEVLLVEQARQLRYRHFARCLAYWAQLADPDGTESSAERQHAARRLHLSQGFGGSWALDGLFDPIDGSIVAAALKRIEDELFGSDWAEAKARIGNAVCATDLLRTPAQRRADALVEMARRAGSMPAGSRKPEPLFTVFVGYETFAGRICELADGTVLTPGSLLRWLDAAWVERAVFDGPDRIRNVGARRRLFTGATKRAVELRDRECFHESCGTPAEHCQIDHVQPWAAGGLTVEDNGRSACGFHRRRGRRTREAQYPRRSRDLVWRCQSASTLTTSSR
ncbi:MAG: HNH endonuclease [Actinomycetota bacterium]|nr:HNH endonuclease [Actinomycetota bacterium]